MFGRPSKTSTPPPDPAGHTPAGYVRDVGLTALPDTRAIGQIAALQGTIGHGLAGGSGTVYGYDVGNAARSLTGPVAGRPLPTQAIANLRGAPGIKPTAEYQDMALTDPDLDPYMASAWRRMQAR